MLFFDSNSIILQNWVPLKQAVNGGWVLCKDCFVECNLRKVRGWETSASEETVVLVSKQCAAIHCTCLNFNGIPVAHPHNSPDFSPCDFWVLPTPKRELQGQKFGCNHEVTQASTTTLDKMSRKSYYTVWVVCSALLRMYRFFTFPILWITIQLLIIYANNCTHNAQLCATVGLNNGKCIACNHHYFRKETMPISGWLRYKAVSVVSLIMKHHL
jgi:hypothetical protein